LNPFYPINGQRISFHLNRIAVSLGTPPATGLALSSLQGLVLHCDPNKMLKDILNTLSFILEEREFPGLLLAEMSKLGQCETHYTRFPSPKWPCPSP